MGEAAQPGRAWGAGTERGGSRFQRGKQSPHLHGWLHTHMGGPRLVYAASLPGGGGACTCKTQGLPGSGRRGGVGCTPSRHPTVACPEPPAVPGGDVGLCLPAGRSAEPFCVTDHSSVPMTHTHTHTHTHVLSTCELSTELLPQQWRDKRGREASRVVPEWWRGPEPVCSFSTP